ncbi:hypothetical protein [Streptomyces sp. Ag109_O5-10]|uniref:hypothetical protein n=2 Tax=unclassified Streptomyces TaxID=2593676 RepID=UPI00115F951E|nr:hypothetical protein [Streptomyces sp. Ag109_O5-10]
MAKAGASIADAIRRATVPAPGWPNTREGLMELFTVLDEWCSVAQESNQAVEYALDARLTGSPWFYRGGPPQMAPDHRMRLHRGFIERITGDADRVLRPMVPWLRRWRGSQRRAEARRTLRSMMMIYCPEILHAYETAVAERSRWVLEHRGEFVESLRDPHVSEAELQVMLEQLDQSLRDLLSVREDIARLIRDTYPLGSGSG